MTLFLSVPMKILTSEVGKRLQKDGAGEARRATSIRHAYSENSFTLLPGTSAEVRPPLSILEMAGMHIEDARLPTLIYGHQ